MISHIHSTTIVVEDPEKALDFYVNTLGFVKALDVPMGDYRFLTVAPPGATTQLVLAIDRWTNGAIRRGGHTGISFITPDIDATYETLLARGVKFKQPVTETPWGVRATWFYDIDGNEFFLNQPSQP